MIHHSRFIAQSTDYSAWLEARRGSVSATAVAQAATPSGLKIVLEERMKTDNILTDNGYMKFGRDNEAWLALEMKARYGVMPNSWYILARENSGHGATPDCLGLDHTQIGEIKTGGKEPGKNPPLQHIRQMQWQMYCADADVCFYTFLLRVTNNDGVFVPGWMEPRHFDPIPRDEAMIADLVATANTILKIENDRKAAL